MASRARLLFVGTGIWPRRLAKLVNTHASELASAKSASLSIANLCVIPILVSQSDIVVRVGFRPGMRRPRARIVDALWKLMSRFDRQTTWVYYWIGSDVLYQLRDHKASRLTKYFESAIHQIHIAGAPWLADELDSIGVRAESVLFPLELPDTGCVERSVDARHILTYIPDSRPSFYGGDKILRLAREFPDTTFDVVGGTGTWIDSPPSNICFHGWVNELAPLLARNPIVIRIVEHDALGGTIREALAAACHAIYTMEVPYTVHVAFDDYQKLQAAVADLVASDRERTLKPNREGADYARKNWDAARLTVDMTTALVRFC